MADTLPPIFIAGQRARGASPFANQSKTLASAVGGMALMLIPAMASAQALLPAGTEGRAHFAINRVETFRRPDGTIQARLFEVIDRPRRGVRYALLAADYNCQARQRILQLREEFRSDRDPVRTVYSPGRVTSESDSAAVAEQLRLVCAEVLPAGTLTMTEFLRPR